MAAAAAAVGSTFCGYNSTLLLRGGCGDGVPVSTRVNESTETSTVHPSGLETRTRMQDLERLTVLFGPMYVFGSHSSISLEIYETLKYFVVVADSKQAFFSITRKVIIDRDYQVLEYMYELRRIGPAVRHNKQAAVGIKEIVWTNARVLLS